MQKYTVFYFLFILCICNITNIVGAQNLYPQLSQFNKEVSSLVDNSVQSIVSLTVFAKTHMNVRVFARPEQEQQAIEVKSKRIEHEKQVGNGTGFIISKDGYIVTNYHVVAPIIDNIRVPVSKIRVTLSDQKTVYTAQLIGADPDSDVAVIKINANSTLQAIQWADSDNTNIGEFALTIGNALGAEHTVGFGIISAVSRKKPNVSREALLGDLSYIQTYAQINPGNSGGPLINMNGQVIGITSFIQIAPHSPGFAIPSNYAKQVVQDIINVGYVSRPSLGITVSKPAVQIKDIFSLFAMEDELQTKESYAPGIFIADVKPNTPASQAGLHKGDIILTLNNKKITNPVEFIRTIRTQPSGTQFVLQVQRFNKNLIEDLTIRSINTRSYKQIGSDPE